MLESVLGEETKIVCGSMRRITVQDGIGGHSVPFTGSGG